MRWDTGAVISITVICLISVLLIALNFDPFQADYFTKALFLVSFFLSFYGVVTLIFSLLNYLISKKINVGDSLTKSAIISILALAFFVLRRADIKNAVYYAVAVLIAAAAYYWLARKNRAAKSIENFS